MPDTTNAGRRRLRCVAMADEYTAIINEARAAIADGREPDAEALEERIRSAAKRQRARPRARALKQLERVLSIHRARGALAAQPAPPAPAPRRPALRARPTITGNMDVRREKRGETLRARLGRSRRRRGVGGADQRTPGRAPGLRCARHAERSPPTRRRSSCRSAIALLRVHLLGRSRDGRLVRRAVISALTRDSWDERWQRRASAS